MNKTLLLLVCSIVLCSVVLSSPISEKKTENELKPIEFDAAKNLTIKVRKASHIGLDQVDEEVKPTKKESKNKEELKLSKNELKSEDEVKPVKKESKDEVKPVKLENEDEVKPVKKESLDEVKPVKLENEDEVKPVKKESKDEVKPVKLENEDEVKPVKKESLDEVKPVKLENEDEVKPVKTEHEDQAKSSKKEVKFDDEVKPLQKEREEEDDVKTNKKETEVEDEVKPKTKKGSELKLVKEVKPKNKDDEEEDKPEEDDEDKRAVTEESIKDDKKTVTDEDSDETTTTVMPKRLSAESIDSESSEKTVRESELKNDEEDSKKASNKDDTDVENKIKTEKVEKRSVSQSGEKPENITPCETSTEFKYYQPHPTDATKYYVCDPWGTGSLSSCLNGQQWNAWLLKCDQPENIKNITKALPILQLNATKTILNCSATEFQCLNEGECVETAGIYKCICGKDFTGEFCESRVDLTDLTHDILDGKFSIIDYKSRLIEENITMEIDYYRRYKDQLDNATYEELIKYLSMYKTGEIRYDTLINRLIEDILHDIYPDAEYLSTFNSSSQFVVSMIRLMPSLLSYSRYSFDRYDQVFAQYQKVLGYLVKNLNRTVPTMINEATEYVVLTEVFLNQTLSTMELNGTESRTLMTENSSKRNIQLNEKEIIQDLRFNFNTTLKATEILYDKINKFQEKVIPLIETDPKIYTVTLGDCKIEGANELVELFNEISASSAQIWDSLVNYGFWYITNEFTTTAKHDNANKFQLSLN